MKLARMVQEVMTFSLDRNGVHNILRGGAELNEFLYFILSWSAYLVSIADEINQMNHYFLLVYGM